MPYVCWEMLEMGLCSQTGNFSQRWALREINIDTLHSEQYMFFKKKRSVLLPCKLRKTLQGFSWGCMVIVLKGSF